MYILIPFSPQVTDYGCLYHLDIEPDNKIKTIGVRKWDDTSYIIGDTFRKKILAVEQDGPRQTLTISPDWIKQGVTVCQEIALSAAKYRPKQVFFSEVGSEPMSDNDFLSIGSYLESSDWDTCILGIKLALLSALSCPEKVLKLFNFWSHNNLFWSFLPQNTLLLIHSTYRYLIPALYEQRRSR